MLEIQALTKSFTLDHQFITPIKDLNFKLEQGELACIMGRSGCGKTTFLNLLALFLRPDEGDIRFQQQSILKFDDSLASRYRNQDIAFVTQQAITIPTLNVIENVMLPMFIHQNPTTEQIKSGQAKAEELLTELGIIHLKDQAVRQLSGGEKRRVIIARALINNPQLVLLDEPTADLDEASSLELITLLRHLNGRGVSMILVTHDPLFKQMSAAQFFELREGRLTKV